MSDFAWLKSEPMRRWSPIAIIPFALIACIPLLPRPVHQVLAGITLVSGFVLAPLLFVARFALVANRITARPFQFSLRSLLVFMAVTAVAVAWLPNAHPIDWLAGIAFDEETIYSPGYTSWGWW